ncbi:LysR family transcriptional regulator [Micromonospora sp. NPDC048999]|uniref:helix-turn-helix domain-containing protein n=1 Tax=Micromonospora sp. NPDC048999 TaxID=3155391 RepID=UPI0033CF45CF
MHAALDASGTSVDLCKISRTYLCTTTSTPTTIRPHANAEVCGADLRHHQPHQLDADDPRLAAQQWINTRLDTVPAPNAVNELRDLHALARWFRRRPHPAAMTVFDQPAGTAATERRRQQAHETLVTAAVATQAVQLLTRTTNASLFACFQPLIRSSDQAGSRRPLVVPHKNLTTVTPGLAARLLTASDPHLAPSDRLRYRTSTPAPRLTDRASAAVAANRARHLPEYLWQEWIIRFRPANGSFTDTIATDIPAALLIPGNPIRNRNATGELTNWRSTTTRTLGLLADQYPDVPAALCALAGYLDTHGSPIDYRRRRTTFTNVPMDRRQWEDLCYRADAHPGKTTRHVNARRYIFTLLTGANLANTRHRLAFPTTSDKHNYLAIFQRTITTPLRDALHDYAQAMLDAADINEPLSWNPPGDAVAGLTLPGREPDDIDFDTVHQLVNVEQLPINAAAAKLDATVEHIRYALGRLHRPGKINGKNTPPASRRLRERAARSLTAEFFHRKYIEAGKDLRTIEAETGIHRKLLARHARALGAPLTDARSMNKPIPIDPDWLREQSEGQQRSASDIAAELGLTPETVRRNLLRFGIARRPQGFGGMPSHSRTYPDLPDDIRRAVEGPHHGWLRLRRLQQIIGYPSINKAAQALNLHLATLVNQIAKLEADIGKPLLHRGRPNRPMSPTEHGPPCSTSSSNRTSRNCSTDTPNHYPAGAPTTHADPPAAARPNPSATTSRPSATARSARSPRPRKRHDLENDRATSG